MSDDAVAAPRRITPDKSSCFYSPRKPRGDFVEFVNLNGETDAFDLTKVEELWGGRSYRDRGALASQTTNSLTSSGSGEAKGGLKGRAAL